MVLTRSKKFLLALIIFVLCFLCAYIFMVSPFRRALPWSASDVQSYSKTYGLSGDGCYYLEAKITKKQYEDYVTGLHLIFWKKDQKLNKSDINWQDQPLEKLDWWNPGLSVNNTYVKADADLTIAKFSEGYLYLRSTSY